MRELILDENYTLTASEYNWTLKYEKEGEVNLVTGKPKVSRDETYHRTMNQGLAAYVDKKLKTGHEISADILAISEQLQQLLNSLK